MISFLGAKALSLSEQRRGNLDRVLVEQLVSIADEVYLSTRSISLFGFELFIFFIFLYRKRYFIQIRSWAMMSARGGIHTDARQPARCKNYRRVTDL